MKVPRHLNLDANGDGSDDVLFLALAGRWPRRTWRSLMERAFYLAERAAAFAERSGGRLRIIETREDLVEYLADRAVDPARTAALLTIEGAHALEDDLANVDLLADAGYRMMSPSHFFDTAFGGSAHGLRKGGLTELGREMIVRMEERGMLVDVAHASTATIADATAHRSASGRRVAYRRVRDARHDPQPQRRPAARHRRDGWARRHRLLGHRDRRFRRRGHRPARSATRSTWSGRSMSRSARTGTVPCPCRSTRPGSCC